MERLEIALGRERGNIMGKVFLLPKIFPATARTFIFLLIFSCVIQDNGHWMINIVQETMNADMNFLNGQEYYPKGNL